MKSIITFLLLFSFCYCGLAQSIREYKGRILSDNNEAISFAHVFLEENHELGVITNEIGEFTIQVSDTIVGVKNFIVSHLLYITDTVSISSEAPTSIHLTPKPNILKEVIINTTRDSVYWIVENAFKSVKKNYPVKSYFCEAFYRETNFVDQENVKTTEAVINIQDFGYKKPDKTRILVKHLRQSEDYSERNSTMVFFLKTLGKMFDESNELYYTFNHDLLRHIDYDAHFFSKKRFLSSQLSLLNILVSETDTIYQIAYNYTRPNSGFKRHLILSINSSDFAILNIEYFYSFVAQNFQDDYYIRLEYQKYNDKYYISLINFNYPDHTNKSPNSRSYQTIHITSVLDQKNEYERIKRKFAESRSASIYDNTYEYDTTFWTNYNKIELPPVNSIVTYYKKRLELLKNGTR